MNLYKVRYSTPYGPSWVSFYAINDMAAKAMAEPRDGRRGWVVEDIVKSDYVKREK
jgi:hypothetical protein